MAARQLTLDLCCGKKHDFDSFLGEGSEQICQQIKGIICCEPGFVYLHGGVSVGKTHLLESSCRLVLSKGNNAMYLDMRNIHAWSPDVLSGLTGIGVVCLDNIESIAGNYAWEESVFNLYNRAVEAKTPLVISGEFLPKDIGFVLPDLRTRLGSGVSFHLYDLNDKGKINVMRNKALSMGFDLEDKHFEYIIHNYNRDLAMLLDLIEKIAAITFETKKKVSLSNIKTAMSI
jgi:DnaA-homolog protein